MDGLPILAHLFVNESQLEVGLGVAALEIEGLAKRFDRCCTLPLAFLDEREVVPGRIKIAVGGDGPPELAFRVIWKSFGCEQRTELVVRRSVPGILPEDVDQEQRLLIPRIARVEVPRVEGLFRVRVVSESGAIGGFLHIHAPERRRGDCQEDDDFFHVGFLVPGSWFLVLSSSFFGSW